MRASRLSTVSILLLTAAFACPMSVALASDELSAWREGEARQTLLTFVARVTDEDDAWYLPREERIAVFDNDGTLWSEEPWPVPFEFVFHRIRKLSGQHPEWASELPYKAVLENDRKWLRANNRTAIRALSATAQAGLTVGQYESEVREFLFNERHPETGMLYVDMVYQPMLELIGLLQRNGFSVYVVSGGETDFIRAYASEIYGIPRQNVIGSRITYQVVDENGSVSLRRRAELESVNIGGFKVINIHYQVGRRPVFVAGNSDGDLMMLRYPETPGALRLLLLHDDAEREYRVDVGNERVRELAAKDNWLAVSMRKDFRRVFPENAPDRGRAVNE